MEIPVRAAGTKGALTAFVLCAGKPALLRKGAMGAPGGQLDFSRDPLTLNEQGVNIPKRVNQMGHYILSVADFGKDPSRRVGGPAVSAPHF